jgi:guanylate kinase
MTQSSSTVRLGRLFVIAAPSGAGKTSLVKALLERVPSLRVSISHTTRQRRSTEEHGREYYFVNVTDFVAMKERGEFLESALVFDNHYGTGCQTVDRLLATGTDVVLEIDWQGAQQVRNAKPDAATVFILPPSRRALEERLRNRRTDSDEVIARRLKDAVGDMSHWKEFDYVVVNQDFDTAVNDLARIVSGQGEDLRADRPDLQPLLRDLLAPAGS